MSRATGGAAAPAVWDVVVIGGGNAALVAAMTARHLGAKVLLLERAPVELRGGNTRHTRNLRCADDESAARPVGRYPSEELYADLCGVGTGPGDEKLARLTVEQSQHVPAWMSAHGVRWQRALAGTIQLERTNRFFLGGGKALVNTYYRTATALGVVVAYDACVESFLADGDRVDALVATVSGRREEIKAHSVVCASGGYEASAAWLERSFGPAGANCVVRGARFNDGLVIDLLYGLEAAPAGEEGAMHAVACDARSPKFDGGIATRIDAIPFGIVVNRDANRFDDEGEDLWPKRYATWGQRILKQEGQRACAVWDAKVDRAFLPPLFAPLRADSIGELAVALGLDPGALEQTIADYNAAVVPGRLFDPSRLDDSSTEGIAPPKSHWAQRVDTPPYSGLTMLPGITFTYRGIAVDDAARVRRNDGGGFANVFAAGEIMSGNILSSGYLAGFGVTIGSVWGRIAGRSAAEHALATRN